MMIHSVRWRCRVGWSRGHVAGGLMATLRFDAEDGHGLLALLHERLPKVLERPGIVGAHLCLGDKGASSVQTEEKKGRPPALVPGWVVLVEGGAGREHLERATNELLDERSLVAAGAHGIPPGVHVPPGRPS